jgi:mRNA-degrading endonuclease RelE of RelBE toxin-antitoxin system
MASFDLQWRASTRKDLGRLSREAISRIVAAVVKLAEEPLPRGSEKLAGSERTYRIRVGDYRVVYELLRDAKIVEIQRVRHRKDVLQVTKIETLSLLGMSTLANKPVADAVDVKCTDDELIVTLVDGRRVSAPLAWFPRLLRATPKQRVNWRLIGRGVGIHWEDVDEDISVCPLLAS